MRVNAVALLDTLLDQVHRRHVEEIRLESGAPPLLISNGRQSSALGYQLAGATISAIHAECLARSCQTNPSAGASDEFQFLMRDLGVFRCKYAASSRKVSLSIYPDETSAEFAMSQRPHKPPELRAEAYPDESNRSGDH